MEGVADRRLRDRPDPARLRRADRLLLRRRAAQHTRFAKLTSPGRQECDAMAESATQRAVIAASPEKLFEVVTDFERYTDWARDLKHVEVLTRDAEGRGVEVRYRAAAMGRSTSYTLRYDYSNAPGTLPWVLARGDIM